MSDLPTLLPENATALERDLEQVTGGAPRIDPQFAWMWDPETIPAELLAYLAWALSVDVWESAWPESVKRAAIRDAIAIHRIKGTRAAVEQAVASVGAKARITEWWEEGGAPNTFRVTALAVAQFEDDAAPILDARLVERVVAAVTAAKPTREHFSVDIGASFSTALGVAGRTAGAAVSRRYAPTAGPAPRRAVGLGVTGICQGASVVRLVSEIGAAA